MPLINTVTEQLSGTGTFTRAGTSACQTTATGASMANVATTVACQDASLGTRVAPLTTNKALNPEDLDLWTAAGTASVTKDATVGPWGGAATAERVQLPAVGDAIAMASVNACAPSGNNDTVHSFWLKNRGAGTCTVWLGNNVLVGTRRRGEYVTIGTTWQRYSARSMANYLGDCEPYLGRLSATATCTDLDAIGAGIATASWGAGTYCSGVSCNAESLEVTDASRFPVDVGTLSIQVSPGDWSTWELSGDKILVELVTLDAFRIEYDASADSVVADISGINLSMPAPADKHTVHRLTVSWKDNAPLRMWWDNQYPVQSVGVYQQFAVAGSLFVGSSSTKASQLGGFYRGLKVSRRYSLPHADPAFLATLSSSLTPDTGGAVFTFGRASAWTCLSSGGGSMADLANDAPCYVSSAEDSDGPDGDSIGVRVSPAATNYVRGDMDGANLATPTGWTGTTANFSVVDTGTTWHGQVAKHTEGGTAVQVIYHGSAWVPGTCMLSAYTKTSSGVAGYFYHYVDGGSTISGGTRSRTAWQKVSSEYTLVNAAGQFAYWGSSNAAVTAPASGTYYVDTIMAERSTLYPAPYVAGVAGTAATAESLSRAFSAGEVAPTRGDLTLVVTPLWASTEAGLDRTVFFFDADFKLEWVNASATWRFTAGGQTVSTAAQTFRREASHLLRVTWANGAPLTIQVNGQTAVSSVGNYATATFDATHYLGTTSGGGAEIGGWIGWIQSL